MKHTIIAIFLIGCATHLYAQEVPNCSRAADIAAALRAGNTQRMQDLAVNASALELQVARMGESKAPAYLGPAEVREGVLRACLNTASSMR